MKTCHGVKNLPSRLDASVVTVGNFDGVHKGHQKLIERTLEKSQSLGVPSVVMTFNPHPVQVLYPEKGLKRLFDLQDLEEQLRKRGVDWLIIEPFSREFSQLPPEAFVQAYVHRPLMPKSLVVGYDFGFGANRSGTIDRLRELGQSYGFDVDVEPSFQVGKEVASSSRIRQALDSGDVALAAELLGRYFYVRGVVEKGEQRGRELGFPTANLKLSASTHLPRLGVYVCRVTVAEEAQYYAVTNVGKNPTFQETTSPRVEAYVLDQELDLYGRYLKVEFLHYIRGEEKFADGEELRQTMIKDTQMARQWLADNEMD